MPRSPARKSRRGDEPHGLIALVKPKRIQTLWVSGRYQRVRNRLTLLFVGVYAAMPWLRWDRAPAICLDLGARKFSFFGTTVLAGRIWCGYGCPQTLWTKLSMWIEHLMEWDRNQLYRGPKQNQAKPGGIVELSIQLVLDQILSARYRQRANAGLHRQ